MNEVFDEVPVENFDSRLLQNLNSLVLALLRRHLDSIEVLVLSIKLVVRASFEKKI